MDYIRNSNLIPIIVGVCLAVLVVVVLVAYLIGRRRNRNGYQSVWTRESIQHLQKQQQKDIERFPLCVSLFLSLSRSFVFF